MSQLQVSSDQGQVIQGKLDDVSSQFMSVQNGSVHCVRGDIYRGPCVKGVSGNGVVRLIFGRGYSAKGATKALKYYQSWNGWYVNSHQSKAFNLLIGVENPFVSGIVDRPIEVYDRQYLWFVNDEEHQGLSNEQTECHLERVLKWAQEQGITTVVTNGAQVEGSDLVCDDPERVDYMYQWAHKVSKQYGMHIVLVSQDDDYVAKSRAENPDQAAIKERIVKNQLGTPHDVLENQSSHEGGTLFYPGSGSDWGPLRLFGEFAHFERVIYCDYHCRWAECRGHLNDGGFWEEAGYRQISCREMSPVEWGLLSWNELWDKRSYQDSFATHSLHPRSHAFELLLERKGRFLTLVLLPTEAIGTFRYLLRRKVTIDAVVLQEHGFGGQWTNFGGESMLYEACQQDPSSCPQWLLIGENTKPWPGYSVASEGVVYRGQMHRFKRALYRLNPEKECTRSADELMQNRSFNRGGFSLREPRWLRDC